MADYNLLDTSSFESFIASQGKLKLRQRYSDIQTQYRQIVNELLNHWKGRGAEAFREDSEKVMSNLVGISDILATMCDTLNDCYDIFSECDNSLGSNNRNAVEK